MRRVWCALFLVVILFARAYAYELLTVRINSQDDFLFEKLIRLGGIRHHYMFRPYTKKEILAVAKSLKGSDDKFTRLVSERLIDNLHVEDYGLFRINPLSFTALDVEFSDENSALSIELQQYLSVSRFFAIQAIEDFETGFEVKTEGDWASANLSELLASTGLWNVSLSVGRGELWWGQGRWGTLLLSNNAGALDHIRLETNSPIELGVLGSLKFGTMLAKLEKNREIPEPLLFGAGASWAVWDIELCALRAIMFGGEGRPLPNSSDDYSALFFATSEHTEGKGLDTNQLFMFCGRLAIPQVRKLISDWKYLSLYFEYGAESELDGMPASIAHVWGIELDFGRTDFRAELAETENPSPWYDHFVYTDGYTYKGEVIGHHIGGCSHGGYVELNQYVFEPLFVKFFGEATRYERRNIVKLNATQGFGVWGTYKRIKFEFDLSVNQKNEHLDSGKREDKLYGELSARLEISIP